MPLQLQPPLSQDQNTLGETSYATFQCQFWWRHLRFAPSIPQELFRSCAAFDQSHRHPLRRQNLPFLAPATTPILALSPSPLRVPYPFKMVCVCEGIVGPKLEHITRNTDLTRNRPKRPEAAYMDVLRNKRRTNRGGRDAWHRFPANPAWPCRVMARHFGWTQNDGTNERRIPAFSVHLGSVPI